MTEFTVQVERYTDPVRLWLDRSEHYLANASPGAFYAVTVRPPREGLFGAVPDETRLLGVCVVGRPVARELPQDGSMGEVTRLFLVPGLPKGTASTVLRAAADEARERGMESLLAYHDRSRHTGCCYKKAGFKRWPTATPARARTSGWESRDRPQSGELALTKKRRWILRLRG